MFNSIGSRGRGEGEFDDPFDVKFDSAGNMYVAEFGNKRIQVMDTSGTFRIDREKVGLATGLHVIENKVYISEFANDSLLAYDTSDKSAAMVIMASVGQGIGELIGPYGITSHDDSCMSVTLETTGFTYLILTHSSSFIIYYAVDCSPIVLVFFLCFQ